MGQRCGLHRASLFFLTVGGTGLTLECTSDWGGLAPTLKSQAHRPLPCRPARAHGAHWAGLGTQLSKLDNHLMAYLLREIEIINGESKKETGFIFFMEENIFEARNVFRLIIN